MATGQDFVDFASQNGILIHPRIYNIGGPDAWVDELADYSGKCPVAGDRTCPCMESVAEVTRPNPEDQHCSGFLYITPVYLEHVDPKGKLYGKLDKSVLESPPAPTTPSPPAKSAPPPPVSSDPAVDAEIEKYIRGVEETQKLYKKGDYEGAFDKLIDLEQGTECEVCKEQFGTEAVHVNNARNQCGLPYSGRGCNEEVKRVSARLQDLKTFFESVRGPSAEVASPAAPEPVSQSPYLQTKKAPQPKTQYQIDMEMWINTEELKQFPQKIRFYMATQLASEKSGIETVEDAYAKCQEIHPEWF